MRTGSWEKGEQRGLPRNKRVSDSGGYSPAEADLREKIEAIHSFDQATPEMNKYVMLVPTAAALYKDKLPKYAIIGDQEAYLKSKAMAESQYTFHRCFSKFIC